MNFLAHAFLSGDNEKILLGNFIGDSVKGKDIDNYSSYIKAGILLHRKIDFFTDTHPLFKQTCQRLYTSHKRYSPVVADMIYDHFLAIHWDKYSSQSLNDFAKHTYFILFNNFLILPPRTQRLLPFIMSSDWLVSYKSFDGLQKRFMGMNRRASFVSNMHVAVDTLKKDYELYEKEFFGLWKDIREFANNEIIQITSF